MKNLCTTMDSAVCCCCCCCCYCLPGVVAGVVTVVTAVVAIVSGFVTVVTAVVTDVVAVGILVLLLSSILEVRPVKLEPWLAHSNHSFTLRKLS